MLLENRAASVSPPNSPVRAGDTKRVASQKGRVGLRRKIQAAALRSSASQKTRLMLQPQLRQAARPAKRACLTRSSRASRICRPPTAARIEADLRSLCLTRGRPAMPRRGGALPDPDKR